MIIMNFFFDRLDNIDSSNIDGTITFNILMVILLHLHDLKWYVLRMTQIIMGEQNGYIVTVLQMYLSYLQFASTWSIIISIILTIISVILVVYVSIINSFSLSNKTLFNYNMGNIYNFNGIISTISNNNNNNNDE